MVIQQTVADRMKSDTDLKGHLVTEFRKHFGTIERWINQNLEDGPLTTFKALKVIRGQYNLTDEEILTGVAQKKEDNVTA